MQIYLLTFRSSYACLDSKVKTNLSSIVLSFSLLLVCSDFEEISICSLDEVCICKLTSTWNLRNPSHQNVSFDSHQPDFVKRLKLPVHSFQWNARKFRLELQAPMLLQAFLHKSSDCLLIRNHPHVDCLLIMRRQHLKLV